MAKFVYRLKTLLDQRIDAKDRAQQGVTAAIRELEKAQETLVELRNKERELIDNKAERRRSMFSEQGEGLSAAGLQERVAHLKGLDERIDEAGADILGQRIVVDECEEEVQAARQLLADAARDAEALLKHKEQLAQRFQAELTRKEELELELDESGTMAFLKRLKDSER